jgi:CRISPR-associated protein Cas2
MDADWLNKLYPVIPHAHPPSEELMLRLIAYDISEPKRLHRIAEACEDYGVRIQNSLFECWLEKEQFDGLWNRLTGLILQSEDRLVAYTLDGGLARRRMVAGAKMQCTERPTCFIV